MRSDEKINALVLIAKNLIEEHTKLEKTLALKEEKEKHCHIWIVVVIIAFGEISPPPFSS